MLPAEPALSCTDWVLLVVGPALHFVAGVALLVIDHKRAEARWEHWVYRVVAVVLFAVAAVTVFAGYQDIVEDRKSAALLEQIAVDTGDDELLQRNLRMAYQLKYQSSQEEAEEFVDSLLESLPDRLEAAEDLERSSKEALRNYRIRWEPLYVSVLASFDARVQELEDKGAITSSERADVPLVKERDENLETTMTRGLNLAGVVGVVLAMYPAEIQEGRIRRAELHLFVNPPKARKTEFFKIRFDPHQTDILVRNNPHGKTVHWIAANTEFDASDMDSEFLSHADAAINEAFTYAVVRAAQADSED